MTLFPALYVSTIRLAAALMRSALATEVPPNFCTISPIFIPYLCYFTDTMVNTLNNNLTYECHCERQRSNLIHGLLRRFAPRNDMLMPVRACSPNRNVLVQSRTIEPAKTFWFCATETVDATLLGIPNIK